jgi:hypothetical protein
VGTYLTQVDRPTSRPGGARIVTRLY